MNTRETGDKEKNTRALSYRSSYRVRVVIEAPRPDMTTRTSYEERYENARALSSKYIVALLHSMKNALNGVTGASQRQDHQPKIQYIYT